MQFLFKICQINAHETANNAHETAKITQNRHLADLAIVKFSKIGCQLTISPIGNYIYLQLLKKSTDTI